MDGGRQSLYAKRSVIASPTLRKPLPVEETLADLDDILTRLNFLESA